MAEQDISPWATFEPRKFAAVTAKDVYNPVSDVDIWPEYTYPKDIPDGIRWDDFITIDETYPIDFRELTEGEQIAYVTDHLPPALITDTIEIMGLMGLHEQVWERIDNPNIHDSRAAIASVVAWWDGKRQINTSGTTAEDQLIWAKDQVRRKDTDMRVGAFTAEKAIVAGEMVRYTPYGTVRAALPGEMAIGTALHTVGAKGTVKVLLT